MNRELVNTIWAQLGGNEFGFMVGAKNLVALETGLSFKFGRNSSKSNHVLITLDKGLDLYHVQFANTRKKAYSPDVMFQGVYGDKLAEIFGTYTGMETRMPKVVQS